ncbi:NT5C1A (predicted) [Pycnogonum litorale]
MSTNLTGYGPRQRLMFDGDESKYELWEVKFLGYMRLQKLHDVMVPLVDETEPPTAGRNSDAFAELVQYLDDRSLSLVIRDAKDDGRKALKILKSIIWAKVSPESSRCIQN